MDVVLTHNGTRYAIDVQITHPLSGGHHAINTAAIMDGAAARAAENNKRNKYQDTPNLIPFVIETEGRWGELAIQWIKKLVDRDDPEDARLLRYTISTQLQLANTEMITSSNG